MSKDDGILTYEKLVVAFDYLKSDEYWEAENERSKRRAFNQVFLAKLWSHNLITESEYYQYSSRVGSNGYLMLSKTQFDKLDKLEPKLKDLITDEQTKKFLWPEDEES
jgi:hypothetical protein